VSDEKTLVRPAPVTLSAGLIIFGSIAVIVLAFSAIADLRSLATRKSVETALGEWPLKDTGLSLEGVLDLMQVTAMIAGACAAACAILGGYVFQRNLGARKGLAFLALPLLITGVSTGGFMVTIVFVSIITLWLQPARDWFNGIAPQPREKPAAVAVTTGWPPSVTSPAVALARSEARPASVTAACVAAWVGSGLTLVIMALSLVVLRASPDQVLAELEKQQPEVLSQEVTGDMVISASFVVGSIIVVWCVFTLIFTTLAFRRVPWARVALVFSGSAATVVTLFGAIGAIVLLPLLMACVLSVSMLIRPEVRQWYAGAPGEPRPQPEDHH
jgi:hypothetical protein